STESRYPRQPAPALSRGILFQAAIDSVDKSYRQPIPAKRAVANRAPGWSLTRSPKAGRTRTNRATALTPQASGWPTKLARPEAQRGPYPTPIQKVPSRRWERWPIAKLPRWQRRGRRRAFRREKWPGTRRKKKAR